MLIYDFKCRNSDQSTDTKCHLGETSWLKGGTVRVHGIVCKEMKNSLSFTISQAPFSVKYLAHRNGPPPLGRIRLKDPDPKYCVHFLPRFCLTCWVPLAFCVNQYSSAKQFLLIRLGLYFDYNYKLCYCHLVLDFVQYSFALFRFICRIHRGTMKFLIHVKLIE